MLLAEYKRIIDEANAKLDKAFDIRPKASISVERVPEFQEKGEAKGRYTLYLQWMVQEVVYSGQM